MSQIRFCTEPKMAILSMCAIMILSSLSKNISAGKRQKSSSLVKWGDQ